MEGQGAPRAREPPVSMPTTTSWHRSLSTSLTNLVSLSCLALVSTALSTVAAFGHALPLAVTAAEGDVYGKLCSVVHRQP